jgi:hypothetical protein
MNKVFLKINYQFKIIIYVVNFKKINVNPDPEAAGFEKFLCKECKINEEASIAPALLQEIKK